MSILLRCLFLLLGWLPLRLLHALGGLLGVVLWVVPNNHKRLALRHLELCMPELPQGERRRLARRSLMHMGGVLMEAPAIWFGPADRLRRWLADTEAQRRLRTLLAGGKGVVVLCPHVGSWELAGMFCAAAGPITSLYKPQKGAADALILEGRARLGARLAPSTTGGVKMLLSALKRGEMAGILPDQDPPPGSGVFAPLFGIPAHTTELVTKLAARTGAPVWFCYAERLPRGRGYRFHLKPAPAEVADEGRGAAALNRGIEDCLTHLPEQYWWSYKRYRRRPAGAPDVYASL